VATEPRKTAFPEFAADIQSVDAVGRQFIEVPLEGAQQSVLGSAADLAALLSVLPDAFAASQRRELSRILKSGNDRDPRVAALQASIEQADVLHATAGRGQARVQRALVALAGGSAVFHGFVSDGDLAPLEGLTVRLTDPKTAGGKTLTAKTEADGHFSIDLGLNNSASRGSGAKPVAQRIADLFAVRSEDPTAAPPGNAEVGVGQVEILRNETLLSSDPTPVVLNAGSVYREYVIVDAAP